MNKWYWAVVGIAPVLGACTTTPIDVTYVEATPLGEPEPKTVVVQSSTPMPLPGQLKKHPTLAGASSKDEQPWKVIHKANRSAAQKPHNYGYFNAIMQYDFMPGSLYQVYSAPLRLTDIQLQPGETIIGKPAAGDTARWILGLGESEVKGQTQQHIYIKPTRPDLHTTLSVNTTKRTYHIELHSYKETYMAAVNWRYPQDEMEAIEFQETVRSAKEASVTASQVNIDQLNFGYEVDVDKGRTPHWMPVKVFDDGRKTFIQFPKDMLNREAPSLFVLSEEDAVQLVNYRVRNEYYVIDRLIEKAELRLGQKKQTIVLITKMGPANTKRSWQKN